MLIGDQPHVDDATLEVLAEALASGGSVLEYGSGASTVFFANRAGHVFSVETDELYAKHVRQAVVALPACTVVMHANIGPVEAWGMPIFKSASRRRRTNWEEYPDAPWTIWEASGAAQPCVVFVDGRFRVASAAASLLRLIDQPEALVLVDDYATRPEYWVLETVADAEATDGRSVVLRPRPDQATRTQAVRDSFAHDWR